MSDNKKDLRLHRSFIKNYKNHTMALFLCFTLTFLLLTVMLVLLRTNFEISGLQAKVEYMPGDCYIDTLSEQQVEQLKNDAQIAWVGVQQGNYTAYQKNNQTVFFTKCDHTAATMSSKLLEGSLPEREGEFAAEKWTLLNLGIEPVVGAKITLAHSETGRVQQFILSGILTDMYRNKKAGILDAYTVMDADPTGDAPYLAYLQLADGVRYQEKMNRLQEELSIDQAQINENPARENLSGFYLASAEMAILIVVIGMVVFYGVYRIAVFARMQQYGILRALGMKKRQLHHMILMELFEIYCWSVPFGIAAGILAARLVLVVSGDLEKEIILLGQSVQITLKIPFVQLAAGMALMAAGIGAAGLWTARRVTQGTIMQAIAGADRGRKNTAGCFSLEKAGSKTGLLLRLGCKYIFRDVRTSGLVMLTVCMGMMLFTGLAYQAKIAQTYRADTKEMNYLNGQYAMTMLRADSIREGVSRKSAQEILNIKEITNMKTATLLPVRVIDESGVARNSEYYDRYNERLEEVYGYSDVGFDGSNQIYKSKLCGYNTAALKELEDYVVEGGFSAEGLAEDEVILSVLRTDDTKDHSLPGAYQEGTPLMDYHAGDRITCKYRKDLQTSSEAYDSLADQDAAYEYRTFRIAAIVSFSYLLVNDRTVYPLLITDDQYVQNIAPDSAHQYLYLDGEPGAGTTQQTALERKLIRIGSKYEGISVRSLIAEIAQNEMLYRKQMVYIYGIAAVSLVLFLIQMTNSLRYRMQTRTKEVCMLRAVGLRISMVQKMILFENTLLGTAAVFAAFVLVQPALKYLYAVSDMEAFGHRFSFDHRAFLSAAAGALAVCMLLSLRLLKEWRTKRIMEGIGRFE